MSKLAMQALGGGSGGDDSKDDTVVGTIQRKGQEALETVSGSRQQGDADIETHQADVQSDKHTGNSTVDAIGSTAQDVTRATAQAVGSASQAIKETFQGQVATA